MNCKIFGKVIKEYLEGSILEKDKAELLAHLEGCNKCRDKWGFDLRLSERLGLSLKRFESDLEVPGDLFYDIMRRIKGIPQPKPYWAEILNIALRVPRLAYAVNILILGVFITFHTISIMDIERIYPSKRISYEKGILAHIQLSREGIAFSDIRNRLRTRIESISFVKDKKFS